MLYKRIMPTALSRKQRQVWEAKSYAALVYHMTTSRKYLSLNEITRLANVYVESWTADFPTYFRFTEAMVGELLHQLETVGLVRQPAYCGCCGSPMPDRVEWCCRCRSHVLNTGPSWNRTYEAQHQQPCPFQVTL